RHVLRGIANGFSHGVRLLWRRCLRGFDLCHGAYCTGRMDESDYRACCDKLEKHLQEVYGIPVVVRDIPPPFTGDLDGSEIDVDFETSPADRLFLILHLFGHTVQWSVNPRAREIGSPAAVPVDERRLPELAAYEREAGGYALSLLHQVG